MSDFSTESEARLVEVLGDEGLNSLAQQLLDVGAVMFEYAWRDTKIQGARDEALAALRATGDPLKGIDSRVPWHLEGDPAAAVLLAGVNHRCLELPVEILAPINEESRVMQSLPRLADQMDDDGLLKVEDFRPNSYGIVVGGHALHYHQLLRRGFQGSMNDPLMRNLLEVGSRPGNTVRVAIDDRRLTTPSTMVRTIEEDSWHGPPLTEAWLDDRNAVGRTVHRYPEGEFRRELGYDAVFAYWRMSSEGKVLQFEELTWPEAEQGEDLQMIGELHGLRYLHSIRDIEAGTFIHCDGAVRAYDDVSFAARRSEEMPTRTRATHYRKIFRLDGDIPTDDWADIVVKWYRGNRLAGEYLTSLTTGGTGGAA